MADARETLKLFLADYGLDANDVVNSVWRFAQENPSLVNNTDLLLGSARETETYKARFAGNAARKAKGLPELSPSAYLQYENAYRNTLRSAGMPVGFYDSEKDLASFIGQDVDPSELNDRLNMGYRAISQADPALVAEAKRLYGIDEGSLAAFFLDPEKAQDLVLRQARATQIATQASKQAQMQLTASEAEALARQGVTAEQAQTGFEAVSRQQELLMGALPGEEELSRTDIIGAATGTNAAAAQRVATRARRRQAEFAAGGQFATGQRGVTGLGEASQ